MITLLLISIWLLGYFTTLRLVIKDWVNRFEQMTVKDVLLAVSCMLLMWPIEFFRLLIIKRFEKGLNTVVFGKAKRTL